MAAVTKAPPAGKMDDRWTALSHWDVHDNVSLFCYKHAAPHVSMVMLELCATKGQTLTVCNLFQISNHEN